MVSTGRFGFLELLILVDYFIRMNAILVSIKFRGVFMFPIKLNLCIFDY